MSFPHSQIESWTTQIRQNPIGWGMTVLNRTHVQSHRLVYNSKVDANQVDQLLNLSMHQVKASMARALAFHTKRGTDNMHIVLSGKWDIG